MKRITAKGGGEGGEKDMMYVGFMYIMQIRECWPDFPKELEEMVPR